MTAELIEGALHYGPDQAKWVRGALGIEVRMLVGGEDTGGSLTMYEYTAPPGYPGPAFHLHQDEDEAFFVLDGTLTLRAGSDTVDLGPGGFAWGPRGIPHGFGNAGDDPVRFICVVVPGNLEQMLVEIADYASSAAPTINPARMMEINRRHGLEVIGPPILSVPDSASSE